MSGANVRHTLWERGIIVVQQLLAVETLQTFQNSVPDSLIRQTSKPRGQWTYPCANCSDHLAFNVIRISSYRRDIPFPVDDLFVRRSVVSNKQEHAHDHLSCYSGTLRVGTVQRTCSATETTLEPVTWSSASACGGKPYLRNRDFVLIRSIQVDMATITSQRELYSYRQTHSEPTPAVTQSFNFLAFSKRSAVRYPGWKGVVIRMSA